jgi:hypothetical protein
LLTEGHAPAINFEINGNTYNKGYLADGIYPQWSTFVKTTPDASTKKKSHFAKCQDTIGGWCASAAFCYCQVPALTWSVSQMWECMNYCVIMHHMIIESERDEPVVDDKPFDHKVLLPNSIKCRMNLQHSSPCIKKFATETNKIIFRRI